MEDNLAEDPPFDANDQNVIDSYDGPIVSQAAYNYMESKWKDFSVTTKHRLLSESSEWKNIWLSFYKFQTQTKLKNFNSIGINATDLPSRNLKRIELSLILGSENVLKLNSDYTNIQEYIGKTV